MTPRIDIDRLAPITDEMLADASGALAGKPQVMIRESNGRFSHRRAVKRMGKWFVWHHGWCELYGVYNTALRKTDEPLWLYVTTFEVKFQQDQDAAWDREDERRRQAQECSAS